MSFEIVFNSLRLHLSRSLSRAFTPAPAGSFTTLAKCIEQFLFFQQNWYKLIDFLITKVSSNWMPGVKKSMSATPSTHWDVSLSEFPNALSKLKESFTALHTISQILLKKTALKRRSKTFWLKAKHLTKDSNPSLHCTTTIEDSFKTLKTLWSMQTNETSCSKVYACY